MKRLLGVSLLCGAAFRVLFYGHSPGVSVPIFLIIVMAACSYVLGIELRDWVRAPADAGLLAAIAALACTYVFKQDVWFQALNIGVVPVLFLAYADRVSGGSAKAWYDWRRLTDAVRHLVGFRTIGRMAAPFALVYRAIVDRAGGKRSRTAGRIGIGLAVSAPVLFVVLALLSSADAAFDSLLREVPKWFVGSAWSDAIPQALLTAAAACYAFSQLWRLHEIRKRALGKELLGSPNSSDCERAEERNGNQAASLDPIVAATILTVLNLVYVLFVAVQFTYLFGAAGGLLPEGATYAEYARRGFFELLAVAVINYSLFMLVYRLCKIEGDARLPTVLTILLTVLTGCTAILLASSFVRLMLYEQAYGFTHLRILVHAFLIYLAIMLALALVQLYNPRFRLGAWIVCVTLAAYTLLNVVNIDGLAARANMERYRETGRIDLEYLTGLSADAVPAIVNWYAGDGAGVPGLREALEQRWQQLQSDNERRRWPSANWSAARAERMLAEALDVRQK